MSDKDTTDKEWADALAAMPGIHNTDTANAGSYSYSYASLPYILDKVKPVLALNGWAVAQDVTTADNGWPQVWTRFYHITGAVKTFGPLAMPGGNNAQAIGSAITYARRYALVAALGLAPDGDDDGQAATAEPHDSPTTTAKKHLAGLFPDTDNAELVTVWNRLLDQHDLAHDAELTTRQARNVMNAADAMKAGK